MTESEKIWKEFGERVQEASRRAAKNPNLPEPSEPQYSEEYYEHLAKILGEERAAWARLPRAERERELTWLHLHFNTADDLAEWPPELDGGVHNP